MTKSQNDHAPDLVCSKIKPLKVFSYNNEIKYVRLCGLCCSILGSIIVHRRKESCSFSKYDESSKCFEQ